LRCANGSFREIIRTRRRVRRKEGIVKTGLVSIAGLCLLAATAPGQPQRAFEVASIKTAPPYNMENVHSGKMKLGMKVDGARVEFGATALTELIARAYRVRTFQVSGPGWMSDERYDILAKLPEGSTPDEIPEMLQSLLAERFRLRVHRDTKEYGVYALVVAKDGVRLTSRPKDYDPAAKNPSRPMTLEAYADMLSRAVDLPVVDMTGLKGEYLVALGPLMQEMGRQMRVKEAGPSTTGPAASESTRGAFDIVEELGLKLESRKMPLGHVLIDHVEKTATEN